VTIEPATIQRAFGAFHHRYVLNAKPAWELKRHARLWTNAQRALNDRDVEGFGRVYDELRRHWQLNRGKGAMLAAPENIFELLCKLPGSLRETRLSDQTTSTAPNLLRAIEALFCVKRIKAGPSIMAISKILHFFNPCLFVIVDRGMVWNWALKHLWLWRPIKDTRDLLRSTLPGASERTDNGACDPLSYVAILIWAGQVLRDNPEIAVHFARYLRAKCDAAYLPPEPEKFEAVAIEWLLLGLVELPPPGVAVASGDSMI
jgi:hypothetical protein